MRKFLVDEEDLRDMLYAQLILRCLEQDGVDNWIGYMEGRNEFIACELNISEKYVEDNDIDFDDVVEIYLDRYEVAKE